MPKTINIAVVFGTRPEAIKVAPVIKAAAQYPETKITCIVTAQHRHILDQVLELFGIRPDYDLNIMQTNQTLAGITTRALEGLDKVYSEVKPDIVLVQGDTSTAFVAGLAAFYHKIPVGHIEAGLRTDDIYNPFPEEMNRRLLTRLAKLQFPPTVWAKQNLLDEGLNADGMFLTGNTVTDALQMICQDLPSGLPQDLVQVPAGQRILLVETHRRENLGQPMAAICRALIQLVEKFPDVSLVFSVHPNPKVREVVMPMLQNRERIHLLEPVPYPTLIRLQREAHLILTDSGGIQEEAPSLGVPTLVLRRTTERPEGIKSGNAVLVGADEQNIIQEATSLLTDTERYKHMSQAASPYGDAKAAPRIIEAILYHFGLRQQRPQEFQSPI
ncbi:MAG: UDP-N-acetylglucosamine 2-epimerase (non-hydrolyzing) [bacterium]|nr:UDP-N-acetylglucosamine 2-epimerase (non-hydrolyzing) [bacterium]